MVDWQASIYPCCKQLDHNMHNMHNILVHDIPTMIYMYNMQNMQNMQTWTPVAFVLIQHRNKGTRQMLFHSGISLGFHQKHYRFGAKKRLRIFQAGG
jgi:hypothetical protein